MVDEVITPEQYGIGIPKLLNEDLFRQGFAHSMRGGQMTDTRLHFKKSFLEGFRAARLLLKELRRGQGILEFPVTGSIKVKSKP